MMSQSTTQRPTVAIIGLGYVGLPLAVLADQKGYTTIGVDADAAKVAQLGRREAPFADPALHDALRRSTFTATTDVSRVCDAGIVVICVPTPVHADHTPDLAPLTEACKQVAPHLQKGALVIIESTVNPGVCDTVVIPALESGSGLKVGRELSLAHCPERINSGDTTWTIQNINRVVGGYDAESLQRALAFYRTLLDAEVKPMGSLKEAEAVKVVENAFRDINIAFVNELAMSFTKLGIDVVNVIEGAATKPFAFMPHYPGCGVGGHCIPVDPYYLIDYARKNGFQHDFLALARHINSNMPVYTIDLVEKALGEKDMSLKGSKVAVLGLAYKPNIDDCRESPAFEMIVELERRGAQVASYDSFVPDRSTASTLDAALDGAFAVVVATAHDAIRAMQPEVLLKHNISVIIDGRNCLSAEAFVKAGLLYKGIGR